MTSKFYLSVEKKKKKIKKKEKKERKTAADVTYS